MKKVEGYEDVNRYLFLRSPVQAWSRVKVTAG